MSWNIDKYIFMYRLSSVAYCICLVCLKWVLTRCQVEQTTKITICGMHLSFALSSLQTLCSALFCSQLIRYILLLSPLEYREYESMIYLGHNYIHVRHNHLHNFCYNIHHMLHVNIHIRQTIAMLMLSKLLVILGLWNVKFYVLW